MNHSYIEEVAQGRWYQPDLVKGYSEDEIKQIEALYSICIQGEFKQFMRCMGRSSGGLLAGDTISLYYLRPKGNMTIYNSYIDELLHISNYDFSYQNVFIFSIIDDSNIYFLKKQDTFLNYVYHYSEEKNIIKNTGLSFTNFLKKIILNRSYNTKRELQESYVGKPYPDYTIMDTERVYRGELLPQSTHIGAEYVDDYLNKQQAYINELIKIHPNRHYDITQIKGYSLSEISAFEHVYEIQITGQLKDFMHYMGRSSGGLLSDDFIFYNKMSLIEKVNYIDRTIENTWSKEPENYHYKDNYFIFMTYKRDNHFFLVTNRKDADMVHHYNSYDQILAKTGKTFLEFIKEVIKYS
ncbi:hypothetical protein [Psychrobacter sp. I-STPA10]|uniref:hypothetical protein n=1 Tax=Psychrobacter sp. I-STPA10 TaxID=2585769 RepID=UPI001E655FED|nr:hypothetical protein [Psychrobacter sp. I-STPA10]